MNNWVVKSLIKKQTLYEDLHVISYFFLFSKAPFLVETVLFFLFVFALFFLNRSTYFYWY